MIDFSGEWQTTFGSMRLTQQRDKVTGKYICMGADCAIAGTIRDGRFVFTYQEPDVRGEGWFELIRGGRGFRGEYQPEGGKSDRWEGERVGFDGLWNSSFGL